MSDKLMTDEALERVLKSNHYIKEENKQLAICLKELKEHPYHEYKAILDHLACFCRDEMEALMMRGFKRKCDSDKTTCCANPCLDLCEMDPCVPDYCKTVWCR